MVRFFHNTYIGVMALITVAITAYLAWTGYEYYSTPLAERFYHEHYDWFKPSGEGGHDLGIWGTVLMAVGVFLYIPAKRYGIFDRWVRLKYLLEFHIFLCTLGPILILFHTTFKFGGVVSIAFWSMVIVVLSGVIGRFIYLQIPRGIEGRALSLAQAQEKQQELSAWLENSRSKSSEKMKRKMERESAKLARQLKGLERMQRYFRYWHIAHQPFAVIMAVLVIVHVVATLLLGFNLY